MQKNFTGIIEGRVDKRSLAVLYKWFAQNGVVVNTKSALLNEIVETLKNVVIENGLAFQIEDIREADMIMSPLATSRDVRVLGNLSKAISVERQNDIGKEAMRTMCEEGVKKFEEIMASKGFDIERVKGIQAEHLPDSGSVQLSEEAQIVPDLSSPFAVGGNNE